MPALDTPPAAQLLPVYTNYWLGKPGGKWIQIAKPDSGSSGTSDQARVDHDLLGGGHTVTRVNGRTRRVFPLAYSERTLDEIDQLVSAAYGLLGNGPYYYVDPGWRNQMAGHVAGAGAAKQGTTGFVVSGGGSVAFDSTDAPPQVGDTYLAGVVKWTSAGASFLNINQSVAGLNEVNSVPVVPNTPITYSVWLKGSSANTITCLANFNDATGATQSQVSLGSLAITTSWARYSWYLPYASAPGFAVTFAPVLQTSSTIFCYVSAMDVQYGVTAANAAQQLQPWVLGLGVPRVLISGTQNNANVGSLTRLSSTLTLVEV